MRGKTAAYNFYRARVCAARTLCHNRMCSIHEDSTAASRQLDRVELQCAVPPNALEAGKEEDPAKIDTNRARQLFCTGVIVLFVR